MLSQNFAKIILFFSCFVLSLVGCIDDKIERKSSNLIANQKFSVTSPNETGRLTVELLTKAGFRYPAYCSTPVQISYNGKEKCRFYIHNIGFRFVGTTNFVKKIRGSDMKRLLKKHILKPMESIENNLPVPIMIGVDIDIVVSGLEICYVRTVIKDKKKIRIYKKKPILGKLTLKQSVLRKYSNKFNARNYNPIASVMKSKIDLYNKQLMQNIKGKWSGLSSSEIRKKAAALKVQMLK